MSAEFNMNTMREYALDFADNGYNIMALRGVDSNGNCKCGNPDCTNYFKHPKITSWSKSPAQSCDQLESLFNNAVFEQSYGIILSAEDLIVDFDPRNNESAVDELNSILGFDIEERCKFVVKTGSGGKHFYFKKPKDIKTVKTLSSLKGIDFLSKGSFAVGCGSHHASGYSYETTNALKADIPSIDEAPIELINLVERAEVIRESAYESGSANLDEVRSALSFVPNDENTDYEIWLSIGMALSYETKGSNDGYLLWEEWSDKSPKHNGDLMSMKWGSFSNVSNIANPCTIGTVFKMAYDNGWEQEFDVEIDLSAFIKRFEEKKAEKIILKNSSEELLELNDVPSELQKIPGILGEFVSYTLSTAKYPLYLPSINAALAFCSLVVGRDFSSDFDNYSSMYLMTIAETGQGKEHPYKVISKILHAANQSRLIKGDVTGKAAIVTELYSAPRVLFVKDEIAHWMQIIGSKGASENKISEVKAWMEVYSKNDSFYSSDSYTALKEILKGKEDELAESSLTIMKPAVSLLGMTTPQKLSESMTKMMVNDGFLNRFLISFAQEGDQKMNMTSKSRAVPQSILSWIETIERRVLHHNRNNNSQGRNSFCTPLLPIELPFTGKAFDLLDKYEDRIIAKKKILRKSGLELMVVRDREKAMKMSVIIELAKDPYSKEISYDSVSFAIAFVEYCSEQMIKYIEFEMVENSIDRRYKEAYAAIESCGTKGILRSDLMKMHPFKSCDGNARREIQSYLITQTEEVVLVEEDNGSGKGRKKHRLYASKFVDLENLKDDR